uniref:Uncharacterized protein n=2 Tax=Helianthus annuus TaxID=4232 RepID=A0A251U7U8_HELAN
MYRLVTKMKSWQKVSSFSWGVREIYRETNQSGDIVDSSGSVTDVSFSNSTKRVFEVAVEYSRTMGKINKKSAGLGMKHFDLN